MVEATSAFAVLLRCSVDPGRQRQPSHRSGTAVTAANCSKF